VIHYHGLPLTPVALLVEQMAGRFFCVSYADARQVRQAHSIGQGVMLDNGAFSVWRRGHVPDWQGYYAWSDPWLDYPTTWAVIPDVIGGTDEENDALVEQWPHHGKGAPVWHMHSPVDRLIRLLEDFGRVCFGSSGQFATVLDERWERRADEAWNAIAVRFRRTPSVHMLRGMACSGERWPFASVDSTDIARNHNRPQNTPKGMAERWDALQVPGRWISRPEQLELIA
jgi:hypothetical protein